MKAFLSISTSNYLPRKYIKCIKYFMTSQCFEKFVKIQLQFLSKNENKSLRVC